MTGALILVIPGLEKSLSNRLTAIMRITDIDQGDKVVFEELFKDGNYRILDLRILGWVLGIQTDDEELENTPVVTEHIILSESYLIRISVSGFESKRKTV